MSKPRSSRHPVLIGLLVFGLLSSPATYRGGSAGAHPHMFLQLWHDAVTGSFAHHGADPHSRQSAEHHHLSPVKVGDAAPDRPTATAFMVSDWGFAKVLIPQSVGKGRTERARAPAAHVPVWSAGLSTKPEIPPPRWSTGTLC